MNVDVEETFEDLPPSAKFVAKVLEYEGTLTQTQLAEETWLPGRTVRYALTRLQEMGLVEERNHLRDARRKLYELVEEPDPRIRADGGSKYTNPTGPGYLGIYKLSDGSGQIPIGVWEQIPWRSDDDLWIIEEQLHGQQVIAVVDEEPDEAICTTEAKKVTVGTSVKIPRRAIEQMDPVPNEEIRVYERDQGGFWVVPRTPDPMLATDGGEDVRSEWTLVCTDCDWTDELEAEGHPRDSPPSEVEDRVRKHKGTVDWSHVVRVEGRLVDEDRGQGIDPSLVTDGGTKYTNPTGPGYETRLTTGEHGTQICTSTIPTVDWGLGNEIVVVDDGGPGLAVVSEAPDGSDVVATYQVSRNCRRVKSEAVNIGPDAIDALGLELGEDIRVYRRQPEGLRIVPADPDPMLARTDGGKADTHFEMFKKRAAPHHCDICDTPCWTIAELVNHECNDDQGTVVTDGGRELPDTLEELVRRAREKDWIRCRRCGDRIARRYASGGVCVGCRHRPVADGGFETEAGAYMNEDVELRIRGKRVHVLSVIATLSQAGRQLQNVGLVPAAELANSVATQARSLEDMQTDTVSMLASEGDGWASDDPNKALDVDLVSISPDGGPDACPRCGELPGAAYRCQQCGKDLVEEGRGVGRDGHRRRGLRGDPRGSVVGRTVGFLLVATAVFAGLGMALAAGGVL